METINNVALDRTQPMRRSRTLSSSDTIERVSGILEKKSAAGLRLWGKRSFEFDTNSGILSWQPVRSDIFSGGESGSVSIVQIFEIPDRKNCRPFRSGRLLPRTCFLV